jgi:hypothetical protein
MKDGQCFYSCLLLVATLLAILAAPTHAQIFETICRYHIQTVHNTTAWQN